MIGEYFINLKGKKIGLLFTVHFSTIAAEKKINDRVYAAITNCITTINAKKKLEEDFTRDNITLQGLVAASHANNIYIASLSYVECEKMTGNHMIEEPSYKDIQDWCLDRSNFKEFDRLMEVYTMCNSCKPVEKATIELKKKEASLLGKMKSWIYGRLKSS